MKFNSVPAPQFPNITIPTTPKRILVLDDDATLLCLYSRTLAGAGYTVDTAADGEQGWEALHANEYDLLLTDHDMPRLTGIELIARIHQSGMTLPVIIASGSIALPECGDGERLGVVAVLHKPFTLDELAAAVQRLVPLQQIASVLIQHREAPPAKLMFVSQPRFAGINE